MVWLCFTVSLLAALSAYGQRTPLRNPYLQTPLDGNAQALTNLGLVEVRQGAFYGSGVGLSNIPLSSLVATGAPAANAVLTGHGWRTNPPSTMTVINVRDFGARGDGVTDDYDAIMRVLGMTNTGIRAVGAFRMVYFPAGVYLVRSNLIWPDGALLVGDAPVSEVHWFYPGITQSNVLQSSGTQIRPHPNWNGTALFDSRTWYSGEYAAYMGMRNLALDGRVPGASAPVVDYAVRIQHAGEICHIENVKMHYFRKSGVWHAGTAAALTLDKVSIHNVDEYAVLFTAGSPFQAAFGTPPMTSEAGHATLSYLSSDRAGIATIGMNCEVFLTVISPKIEQITTWAAGGSRYQRIIHVTTNQLAGVPSTLMMTNNNPPTIYVVGGHINHDLNLNYPPGETNLRPATLLYSDVALGRTMPQFRITGTRIYGSGPYAYVRAPDMVIPVDPSWMLGYGDQVPTVDYRWTNVNAVLRNAVVQGRFIGDGALVTNIMVSGIAAAGQRSSSTFLAGDGVWRVPPGGEGGMATNLWYPVAGHGMVVVTNTETELVFHTVAITNRDSRAVELTNVTVYGSLVAAATGSHAIPVGALTGDGAVSNAYVRWNGQRAEWSTLTGGEYPQALATNRVWVSVHGNDSTGQRNNPTRPFRTLTAAFNAAMSGDVIVLLPGEHVMNNSATGTKSVEVILDNARLVGGYVGGQELFYVTGDLRISGRGSLGVLDNNSRNFGYHDTVFVSGNLTIDLDGDVNVGIEAGGILHLRCRKINVVSYVENMNWRVEAGLAAFVEADDLEVSSGTYVGDEGMVIMAPRVVMNIGRIRAQNGVENPLTIQAQRAVVGPTVVDNVRIKHDGSMYQNPHAHHAGTVIVWPQGYVATASGTALTGQIVQ